jgi:hypothetical protein
MPTPISTFQLRSNPARTSGSIDAPPISTKEILSTPTDGSRQSKFRGKDSNPRFLDQNQTC